MADANLIQFLNVIETLADDGYHINFLNEGAEDSSTLWIIRGVSGSGKSTVSKLINETSEAVICSTDDFFMVDGEYKFDGSKLGVHHQANLAKAILAMNKHNDCIIDNTNTEAWHFEQYVKHAESCDITVVEVFVHGLLEVGELHEFAERNVHGVPFAVILRQYQGFIADVDLDKAHPEYILK